MSRLIHPMACLIMSRPQILMVRRKGNKKYFEDILGYYFFTMALRQFVFSVSSHWQVWRPNSHRTKKSAKSPISWTRSGRLSKEGGNRRMISSAKHSTYRFSTKKRIKSMLQHPLTKLSWGLPILALV